MSKKPLMLRMENVPQNFMLRAVVLGDLPKTKPNAVYRRMDAGISHGLPGASEKIIDRPESGRYGAGIVRHINHAERRARSGCFSIPRARII